MIVVTGLPGYSLVNKIAGHLGVDVVDVYEKTFPDGELYVKLSKPELINGRDVLVVSTLYPDQNTSLLKTLLVIDAVKRTGSRHVFALIPYLAYSRQDKMFLPGEPISACLVMELLKSTGVDVLLTIDIHSKKILDCFKGMSVDINVSDILVSRALNYLDNPVVIAPDTGALERASNAAKIHSLEYDYLVKQRDRVTGEVTYTPRELNIVNRDVIIVDDIISTGGTISEASRVLLKKGARRIVVAATHGLLVDSALNKLESSGVRRVILADTLNTRHRHDLVEYVDISERAVGALIAVLE